MEPEGSLPHSQVPAICPYPEPDQSSPCFHIPLSKDYPPIYAWVSQVVSFPQVSSPETCIRLSFPPYVLHTPPISFFSIRSPEQQWGLGHNTATLMRLRLRMFKWQRSVKMFKTEYELIRHNETISLRSQWTCESTLSQRTK